MRGDRESRGRAKGETKAREEKKKKKRKWKLGERHSNWGRGSDEKRHLLENQRRLAFLPFACDVKHRIAASSTLIQPFSTFLRHFLIPTLLDESDTERVTRGNKNSTLKMFQSLLE